MLYNYDDQNNRPTCTCGCTSPITVLVSVIAGIVFATVGLLLFSTARLTMAYIGVAAMTGIAVLVLLALLFNRADRHEDRACDRRNKINVLLGTLGSIFAGILAISVFPFEVIVLTQVLYGLLAFFFAYMIVSVLFDIIF